MVLPRTGERESPLGSEAHCAARSLIQAEPLPLEVKTPNSRERPWPARGHTASSWQSRARISGPESVAPGVGESQALHSTDSSVPGREQVGGLFHRTPFRTLAHPAQRALQDAGASGLPFLPPPPPLAAVELRKPTGAAGAHGPDLPLKGWPSATHPGVLEPLQGVGVQGRPHCKESPLRPEILLLWENLLKINTHSIPETESRHSDQPQDSCGGRRPKREGKAHCGGGGPWVSGSPKGGSSVASGSLTSHLPSVLGDRGEGAEGWDFSRVSFCASRAGCGENSQLTRAVLCWGHIWAIEARAGHRRASRRL